MTVSVALCTFNGSRFIDEQLRSILAETPLVSEIVVADDGSSDDTVAKVRRLRDETERTGGGVRIRILDGVGGHGVTKNFERAITACTGELIALSDQDDVWLPGRLARQVAVFTARKELTLLFANATLIDARGEPLGASLFDTLEVARGTVKEVHAGNGFSELLRRNLVTGSTVLFRRSLLQQACPIPSEWVHDEWLGVIAAACGQIDLLENPVTGYRQHGGNEIGVLAPTLRNKIHRVLQPRGSRNRGLMIRSGLLVERLNQLPDVTSAVRTQAEAKSAFETRRATLPANRFQRILPVLSLARAGDYDRFASQGKTDIIRDLVQPV